MKGFQTLVALNQFERGQECLQMQATKVKSDSLSTSKDLSGGKGR